jgi:hypothetical protein
MANGFWQHLTIPVERLDSQRLLKEWRWIVPNDLLPLWLTSFGDWAFKSQDGQIYFLDILEGSLSYIAPSARDLDAFFQGEENQNRWLMANWVAICADRGLFLSSGQCYGWKVAPVIGGKFEFLNIQVFDIAVYECIMGQLLRQVQAFPEGYVITEFKLGRDSK